MANSSPPAGWQYETFDDTGWPHATITVAHPGGADNNDCWTSIPQLAGDEEIMVRRGFVIPAGTVVTAAFLASGVNGTCLAIYVNHVLLFTGPRTGAPTEVDVAISPSILHTDGSVNEVAFHLSATGASGQAQYAYGVSYTHS